MAENAPAIEVQQPGGNKWNQQDVRGIIIAKGIVQQRSEDPPGNRDASDEPQAEQQPAPVILVRQGQSVMLPELGTLVANAQRLNWPPVRGHLLNVSERRL